MNIDLAAAAYQKNRLVDDHIYLKDLSNVDRAVYQHKKTKKVTIAFRGTDPTNWRDLSTDALMTTGWGSWGTRFKNARKITEEVIRRYGRDNVVVTGHSLGGAQALHVSQRYGVKAEVFNPYVHPSDTNRLRIRADWDKKKGIHHNLVRGYPEAVIHTNVTDPVALFAPLAPAKKHRIKYDVKRLPTVFQHGLNHQPSTRKRTGSVAVQA